VALTTHPPSIGEVKEILELYVHSPSRPSWPVLGQNIFISNEYFEKFYDKHPPVMITNQRVCLFYVPVNAIYWTKHFDGPKWNTHEFIPVHEREKHQPIARSVTVRLISM
jgi:hypothetical protein